MTRARGAAAGLLLLATLAAVLAVGPATSAATAPYAFAETQTGSSEPVRWNPCAPITYRINSNGLAGTTTVNRVRAAVAEAASASGIQIVYLGRTSFVPDDRNTPVPSSVGANVVITWAYSGSGSRRSALLPAQQLVVGVGDFTATRTNQGFLVARSGFVVFNAAHFFSMSARKQYAGALHELGHLLGLDHVTDRAQVMYPTLQTYPPTHYAAGDRLGLRKVGRSAGCLVAAPAPKAPTVAVDGDRIRISTSPVSSVSGPVSYALYSPQLGGRVGGSTTPTFSIPLANLARHGLAGRTVSFTVRAANRVGAAESGPVVYPVPRAVVVVPPSLVATPGSLDVVAPHAVLKGTSADVSDQLRISTSGTVEVYKDRGLTYSGALYPHNLFFGLPILRFEVTGSVLVEGPGLAQRFDVTGSYLTTNSPPVGAAP